MMVKFYFGSTFLNGFEVLRCLERDQMKKKNCAKCRAGIYFIIFVQRAGVVSKTNINVKEEKQLIAFMLFGQERNHAVHFGYSRQLFSLLLITE